MSITIQNLRIIPYGQKDTLKPVFGDTMHLTFTLADAPQAGDGYTLALDYERILLPTMRPLCAMATEYTAAGTDISFELDINTERFAQWVSALKKPTPIWLQLQRERGGVYTTLLLDDVLALPSVVDGANMVFPGTPLEDILREKADLVDGKVPSSQLPPGFEQQQADWDESDSSDVTYIRNKPSIGASRWGSIDGDLSDQTDLANALDGKANLVGGKVPSAELPIATANSLGAVRPNSTYGTRVNQIGEIYIFRADEAVIDNRGTDLGRGYRPIVPSNLDYAVRSVLPNVTTIPSATTSYSLLDASATTNDHSWQYFHAPEAASVYALPTVTDGTRTHECILTVRFSSSVLTYAFEDSAGNPITPLPLAGTIADGSVVCFRCTWEALLGQWVIMPVMLGTYEEVEP